MVNVYAEARAKVTPITDYVVKEQADNEPSHVPHAA
jgi:hypothetical protein